MRSNTLACLVVVVGLAAFGSSASLPLKLGQTRSPYGSCKSFQQYSPVHFFDVEKFSGKWYVQEQYYLNNEDNVEPQNLACYTYNIEKTSVDKILKLDYRYDIPNLGQGVAGVVNYTTENGVFPLESIWTMVAGDEPQVPVEPYTPLIWVQLDYESWAIAYDCRNIETPEQSFSLETMVLYTRNATFDDQKTLDILHIVIGNYGFSSQNMGDVDNSNCDTA
ncbi:Apolipoprotein D [Orchesella cincta]|uniref:Apolipoprotein D n=1 Tax=Orchesella cincta TaxID=48709 RepID=A0A1D2MJN6_ORCCI|nr:Apolipoprotein D [Orchesella cincta]